MTHYADACILSDISQSSLKMAVSCDPVTLITEPFSGSYYNISLQYIIMEHNIYFNVKYFNSMTLKTCIVHFIYVLLLEV